MLPSSPRAAILPGEIRNAIDRSDCVLAIITSRTSGAVEKELSYAQGRNKLIIPIVQSTIADSAFFKNFPQTFKFSPLDPPGKIETEVVDFLKKQQISKANLQIVGALVAIGLGLLLLSAPANK